MKKNIINFFLILFTIFNLCGCAGENYKIYKYAPDAPQSKDFAVTVNDAPCLAYPAAGGDIANFDLNGEVEIKIKSIREIKSVTVRPVTAGIKPTFDAHNIAFKMNKAQFLSVEINGDLERPLFIFANAPEKSPPNKNDKNTMYFQAGKIYNIEQETPIPSGTTLYIEGGAIVYGTFLVGDNFKAVKSENIKICGRGIISGEKIPWRSKRQGKCSNLLQINCVKNLQIEGITAVQSPNWTIPIFASQDINIDAIKTVGKVDWDDGIDIVSCKNVMIKNSFIYNKDDCIAIKAAVDYSVKYFDHNQANITENVTVKNCTLWNGIYGNCLEIGFETRGDEIKNIVFENLDIIHTQDNPYHINLRKKNPAYINGERVFTIHNGDRAHIKNVLYKNIRVEDMDEGLIDFRIMFSRYSKDKKRGKISNVRMQDIFVTAPKQTPTVLIEGFDENFDIKNVTFKNFFINGKKIENLKQLNAETKFVSDIKFEN